MDSTPKPDPASLVGRFVVVAGGIRHTGITFDELTALLNRAESSDPADEIIIHRIHRVYDDGKMELVGTEKSALVGTDCLLLPFAQVRDARAEFERLKTTALESPPPCRIHLALKKISDVQPPHVVGLVFPVVCSDAIRHWLNRTRAERVEYADGGATALERFEAGGPAIVEATLKTERDD